MPPNTSLQMPPAPIKIQLPSNRFSYARQEVENAVARLGPALAEILI
jgi:hypothetical protein